jgi:hypothetical protein
VYSDIVLTTALDIAAWSGPFGGPLSELDIIEFLSPPSLKGAHEQG